MLIRKGSQKIVIIIFIIWYQTTTTTKEFVMTVIMEYVISSQVNELLIKCAAHVYRAAAALPSVIHSLTGDAKKNNSTAHFDGV